MQAGPSAHTAGAVPPNAEDPRAAFARWSEPARLPMLRLARRLAPHADPDDVVQDALARAWQKRAHFDATRGSALTWLLAIVADQARASRRRRDRWRRVVDDAADVPDTAGPDVTSHVSSDLDLERAIGALAGRQQLAIHLHYFVGLSVDETAAVMSCSAGTVKSTLHDARSRLRRLLGDADE